MSLGLQCGWPSMSVPNGGSPMSMRNVLGIDVDLTRTATNNYSGVDCFSQSLKHPSQTTQTYNQQVSSVFHTTQYSPHPYFSPAKPQMSRINNFINPSASLAFNSAQQQRCTPFGSNTQCHSNVSSTTVNHIDDVKLQEWQEGFRALLPNVNVRFVPDLGTAGLSLWQLKNGLNFLDRFRMFEVFY